MDSIKKYVNIKNLFILLLILILFRYSAIFQILPIVLFKLIGIKPNQIFLTTFSDICLLILLITIFRKDLNKEFKIFKKNILKNLDIGFTYWIIGLSIMLASNIIINFIFRVGGAQNEKLVQEMISKSPILMLLVAGIIAPIIEELIFRKSFKNAFTNKYLFIILSGLVFGLLHVISGNSLLQLLYIIPYSSLGIAFAISYCKTETVFTPISMHIIHNTLLIMISIFLH